MILKVSNYHSERKARILKVHYFKALLTGLRMLDNSDLTPYSAYGVTGTVVNALHLGVQGSTPTVCSYQII